MTTTAKPTVIPSWTTGQPTQISQPTPSLQASGFTAGQRPAFQTLNFLLYNLSQWVQYLDAQANGQLSGLEIGNCMRLTGGGTWGYSASTGVLSWSDSFALSTPSIPDPDNTVPAGSVSIQPGQLAYVIANLPFATTGNTQTGSTALTQLPYELGIVVGQMVTGAGIPVNTTVTAIGDGQVTVSNAATATASNVQLTFAGTATPVVKTANGTALMPSPNVIIIAACTTNGVIVGVNSGQMRLLDGEQKRLLGTGYIHTVVVQAGQALTAGQAIYLAQSGDADTIQATVTSGSPTMTNVSNTANVMPGCVVTGAGLPQGTTVTATGATSLSLSNAATSTNTGTYVSSRIPGAAYAADVSKLYGAIRGNVAGVVTTTPTISQSAPSLVRFMTSGVYANYTGLAPGKVYYVNTTTPGGLQALPAAATAYNAPVGVALSSTTLFVQPLAAALPPTADSNFNDILLSPMSGSSNPVGFNINGPNGNVFAADVLGNLTMQGALMVYGATNLQSLLTTFAGISSNGAITAPSFVSAAGFKCIGPTAYYWGNGQASGTNYVPMNIAVVPNLGSQTASFTSLVWTAPRAGSVTALSVYFDRSNTVTFVFRLNIGGVATSQLLSTAGNGSITFSKGAYPFTANQGVSIQCAPLGGTPTAVVEANFEVEMGA